MSNPAFGAVDHADAVDELEEAGDLFGEALVEFKIDHRSLRVEDLADAGDEDALGEGEGVAVAEDHLELLDRAQGAPGAVGFADVGDRPAVEAFGELEHVDEIL